MTIEVRQLTISSTVASETPSGDNQDPPVVDVEAIRDEILAECRQMIRDMLRAERER